MPGNNLVIHTHTHTHKHFHLGLFLCRSFIYIYPDTYVIFFVFSKGMMIVFGGNTHNDTSHSFGAKCYSNELLAYDVVCDSWHYMIIPLDLRDSV